MTRTTSATPHEVLPMKEARDCLPQMSRCFREQGAAAEPVFFGSHRQLIGVMLSYERYLQMLELVDDLAAALEVRRRDRDDDGERITLDELIDELGIDESEVGARS